MIQRTRISTVLLVLAGATALGWAVVRALEGRGTYIPVVPWVVDAAIVVLAAVVLWAGLAVRAYQQGRRPNLDGIRAARTLVLAKAAALTGALLAGWYLAQVLVVVGDLAVEARREKAVAAGAAALAALALAVVGLVVERWCQLPPSGTEDGGEGARAPGGGTPA